MTMPIDSRALFVAELHQVVDHLAAAFLHAVHAQALAHGFSPDEANAARKVLHASKAATRDAIAGIVSAFGILPAASSPAAVVLNRQTVTTEPPPTS